MADASPAQPVKLLCGLLAGQAQWLDAASMRLASAFGPIDLVSDTWPHTFTSYYEPQMGPGLLRRFVSFERLIDPGLLSPIKRQTNDLEAELARQLATPFRRPANIDPGYIAPSKLVLASAKDFSHRIYLGDGIFAELTLQFRHGGWQSLNWTFPDYASGLYDAFLTRVRERLREASNS